MQVLSLARGLRLLAWLFVVGYVAFVGWELARGYAAAERGESPLYTDYTSLYAASVLVGREPAENLYRPRSMYRATVDTAYIAYGADLSAKQADAVTFAPWMYPPTFILVAIPLAYLPYLSSFVAWILVTAIPFIAAMRAILSRRDAIPFSLAAPPVFFNLAYGQSGFLSGGLIGLGLTQLSLRPLFAGLCIGLASVKPHLGILIPVALAAGGHWRTFAAATATVLAMIVASIAILGADPWFGFIGSMWFHLEGFSAGAYTWSAMTSVVSTAYLAGASIEQAFTLQYISASLIATTVAVVWYRGRQWPETQGLQSALVCLATPLVIPMVYLYDLVIIIPGLAWLWLDMEKRGAHRGEIAAFALSIISILAAFLVAAYADLQIGGLCVAILFGITLSRFWRATA